MPSAGTLLINPRSGDGGPSADELAAEARLRDIDVVVLRPGDDPVAIARDAPSGAIGVAGGDGSLAGVAAVAVDRRLPFVCIPFGTRNHFARDLGLDREDPLGALDAFGGVERRVDLGRANELPFLNNVSLGIYAELVRHRERHRRRGEGFALLKALRLSAGGHRPLALSVAGTPYKAHVLLVANNAFTLHGFSFGERERLDEGLLHSYVAERVVPPRWDQPPPAGELVVEVDRPHIDAAVDGEPVLLATPLHLFNEPGALTVLMPRG